MPSFADFELDLRRHELRRLGRRVPLQEQPYQILVLLLERPGEIVSRDALRERLWPSGTYVEFEKSINVAVMKLRDALGDSAGEPRFVETLPRLGYRFIAEVEDGAPLEMRALPTASALPLPGPAAVDADHGPPDGSTVDPLPAAGGPRWWEPRRVAFILVLLALLGATAMGIATWRMRADESRPAVRSLAVLPFVDQSPQTGEEYLAAGLTEELITRLAQIGTLKVTSRTSSEALRGSRETVPVLARRLGVDAVVEGSVARFGSRVRISAQLVHGASDRHLWARRYEEDERDLLGLQNVIARDIAREIAATLRPDEERRLAGRQTGDPEAYREYLKGRYLLARRSADGFLGAIRHFRRAIALDDQLALGHLGLAITFEGMESLGVLEGAAERIRASAERALELDADLAEAHAALGYALRSEGRWAEAEAELRRAIELSPSSAYAHLGYGHLLTTIGRHGEALAEAREAVELDPMSPLLTMSLAWTHFMARDYPAAIAACRRSLELDPSFPETLQMLARAHAQAGDTEAAASAYGRWARAVGFSAADQVTLERRYAAAGLPGIYRFLLELEARDEEETGDVWPVRRARLHALLGEGEEAWRWLDRAGGGLLRVTVAVDPDFDGLRGDPRFAAFLQRRGEVPPSGR